MLASTSADIRRQFDHPSAVNKQVIDCAQSAVTGLRRGRTSSASAESSNSTIKAKQHDEVDRPVNVTGVFEYKDSAIWRANVEAVLHATAGRDVVIVDAIILGGRFVDGKRRVGAGEAAFSFGSSDGPVQSTQVIQWTSSRAYNKATEPLATRRANTLERIKQRAVHEKNKDKLHG